ncbi:MAG: HD domain-containing protein [Bacteroidota bacterium]
MSIIDTIIKACEDKKPYPIKKFDGFEIEAKLGKGQQGVVLKIKNKINKQFALKFYQPTDKDPSILKESIKRFINEVNTLATLKHKNIVKIYTGGYAKWNKNKWEVTEGFPVKLPTDLKENEFFYYIMDFIDGFDLAHIFNELGKSEEERSNENFPISFKLKYFEILIKQVSKAMIYYHKKKITHKDIKPENIRFSIHDSTFILVDFGFAHHITSPQNEESIPRTDYIDLPSIKAKDYEKNDMGQFSEMLTKVLPTLKDEYLTNRYSGLESSIDKGKNPDLKKRYKDMDEFYNHIKQYFLIEGGWRFQLKLDEFLTSDGFGRFDSKLRIPVSGSILLSKEIKALIDTPQFQRLRGVRQLGPTIFVFPGANHTRFEHSLGVYSLALRYLEKLLSLTDFKNKCEPLEKSIKLIVLSTLLHDIGHYPYSHWIEEIDELPNKLKLPSHEQRAKQILEQKEIKDVIENSWQINISEITDLICNNSEDELINSFINSVIDVDKLDYLIRDSVHCGINYGKGIDVERLLDALYVNNESNKLCVTEKGRSALLSILATRNIMYQEVYWHKTVRACEAMFKRFFYEYVLVISASNEKETNKKLNDILNKSDDEFISTLYKWSIKTKDIKLKELIQPFAYGGRKLIYKPAYIYFDHNLKETAPINKFFRSLLNTKSYKELIEKSIKLANLLKDYIPDLDPLDIILERTPLKDGEKYILDGFKIFNTRKKEFDEHPKEIDSLNSYLGDNRQAYIFCNPKHYEKLLELTLDQKLFQNILKKI